MTDLVGQRHGELEGRDRVLVASQDKLGLALKQVALGQVFQHPLGLRRSGGTPSVTGRLLSVAAYQGQLGLEQLVAVAETVATVRGSLGRREVLCHVALGG